MANETGKGSIQTTPQDIPLSKIHDLPGVMISKPPDKSYGGLVTSIQSNGVKEPVILRLREDGEYQLLAGYRRRRASELAKKADIPALIYEMTLQEAVSFYNQVKVKADTPVPGKLMPTAESKAEQIEKEEKPTESTKPDKPAAKEEKPPAQPAAEKPKEEAKPIEEAKATVPSTKAAEKSVEPVKNDAPKPADARPADKQEKAPPAANTEKPKETAKEPVKEPVKQETKEPPKAAPKEPEKQNEKAKTTPPTKDEKPKEEAKAPAVTGPAARGPAGTAISQLFEERLSPPDEKALKSLPQPKDGESFFIVLHPAYLEKSKFNEFSVDKSSENYKELRKSIELGGIHDPVLARPKPEGGLEILSGQRRHLVALELNYPVPAIIQKIDDADAKIIVADGNLHRDKITTYDLSRALRMKMEGMKQKAGRRKKSDVTAEALNSDEKLAMEMGMSVSKLNRIIRLSEASKDVCDRVDDGSLALSIASAISFLKPKNQDEVLYLADMGYKVTNDRVERMKKAEKAGKLDEKSMRDILDDKDIAPKIVIPPAPTPMPKPESAPPPTSNAPPYLVAEMVNKPTAEPVFQAAEAPAPATVVSFPRGAANSVSPGPTPPSVPAPKPPEPGKVDEPFKGAQERPEHTKVILSGDRLRKYFPDVSMTPREIEESVYDALEERRQRQEKNKQKEAIFKKSNLIK